MRIGGFLTSSQMANRTPISLIRPLHRVALFDLFNLGERAIFHPGKLLVPDEFFVTFGFFKKLF